MEDFTSKEPGKNLASEIEQLAADKHSLEEELIQCKADKDFVWTLWKRLQTAKPDMASVISMVIAREKEKTEKKDLKILEILRLKDEKIMEMRQAMNEDKDEVKLNKERLHELLIENDELKQKLDERESELSGNIKEMENRTKEIEEKNLYLSQLVKAYQEEKEAKDKELKENLEQIENEKNVLKSQIKNLENEVEKLNNDRTSLGEAMKTNVQLKDQIKEMESKLDELATKSENVEKQHGEAITALKVRESQLQEEKKASQFLSGEVRDKDKELIRLRAEIAECRNAYDHAVEQSREQTTAIERLQGMQGQVYQVMEDHKQSYEKEIMTLQKEVMDLQHRCTEHQTSECNLRHEIGVLQQNKASDFEDIITKDRLIEELQQTLHLLDETNLGHGSPQKRVRLDQACKSCKDLTEKLETLETEYEDLSDAMREKTRRISSLEMTVKSCLSTKGANIGKRKSQLESAVIDERTGSQSEDIETLKYKTSQNEKRVSDLKRLLELKDSELTEVRRAHNQRQQRYRMLKENYGLVRNQLRTFENEPVERTPPERPSERALRHEDSDGVWNELTHYRGEYEKLNQERHDVLEELDVLRVEHANDLTTIQELKLCIEEEKEGFMERFEKEKKNKVAEEREYKQNELLRDEVTVLRDIEKESKGRMHELEDEILYLKQELKIQAEDNAGLKRNIVNLEQQLNSASREIEDRIDECEHLRVELRDKESRRSRSPSRSPAKTKRDEEDDEFFKQQLKDIDMYDQQLKKIAQKILSPSKIQSTSPSYKEHQGTQTLEVTRTADFSSFVDLDRFENEPEVGVVEVDARVGAVGEHVDTKFDTSRKFLSVQTPRSKKALGTKKTPGKGEWSSMRQRILSLTQQVAAIRSAKDKAVKSLSDEKLMNENLRSELSTVVQRLQVSKNSVQTLTEDLKKCMKEKEELLAEKQSSKQNDNESEAARRKTEEKLKTSSIEVSRLTCLVKTLRAEKNELKEKLAESQQRLSRVEKDITQKKTFVEEMKIKLRKALDGEERSMDTVKNLEDKIRRLTDRDTQRKLQMDSIKRQLDAETKEKDKFRQQYFQSLEEVKKKTRLLADSRSLRGQAEMVVTEMEAAATEQLQNLAYESEVALKSLRNKLDKMEGRVEEFQVLIKTLADEILADTERACFKITQIEEQLKKEESSKPSSKHARDLACSILNMTSDDLDDFMKDNHDESEEQLARKEREKEWKNTIDVLLSKEVPFAVPLIEVLLDIIEGRKSLEGRLQQLTKRNC